MIQAGVDVPGRTEPVELDYGPFDVTPAPNATLDTLLLEGDVDAVISARPPAGIQRGDPRVRRLFADPVAEELAYFRETGVFPIMHLVVLRRTCCEAHPAVAGKLFAAFDRAKHRSLARALTAVVPSYPLPWAACHARQARELLGDDFWPYGLEPNRAALEAFLGYAAEQRLTDRRLAPEELVATEFVASRRP